MVVSALISGFDIVGDLRSAPFVGSLTFQPLVWRLIIGVFRRFWHYCFAIASNVPVIFFLTYVVLFSRRRIFCQDYFLLSDGIFSVAVFTDVM